MNFIYVFEKLKLKNERFSFSGQPILYLGSSILDILFELRKKQDDFEQVAISAYTYFPTKDKKPLRVFDLTNVISKKIFETYFYIYENKEHIDKIINVEQIENNIDYVKDFKRYILMQLCTFPRSILIVFLLKNMF